MDIIYVSIAIQWIQGTKTRPIVNKNAIDFGKNNPKYIAFIILAKL